MKAEVRQIMRAMTKMDTRNGDESGKVGWPRSDIHQSVLVVYWYLVVQKACNSALVNWDGRACQA